MGKREDDIKGYIRTNFPADANKIRAGMNHAQLTRLVQELSGGIPKVLGEIPDALRSERIFGSIATGETSTQTQTTVTSGSGSDLTIGTTTTGNAGTNAAASITDNKLSLTIPRGNAGVNGSNGSAATVAVGTTSTLSAGASATVGNSGSTSAATLDFGIPQGTAGTNGSDGTDGTDGTNGTNGTNGSNGAAATITVGTTTTGAAGSPAVVANSGSVSAAVFDFEVPQGTAGTNGSNGSNGTDGTNGSNGSAATIAVGSVATGAAGSATTVSNSGSTSAATFDFSIPKGDTGDTGAAGQGVPVGGTVHQALTKVDGVNYNTQWGGVIEFAQTAIPTAPATGNIRIGAGNNTNTFAINTEHGYINMGMQNGGTWAHMKTSATYFYFHRSLQLDGGDGLYAYDGDFWVKTDDKNNAHHERLTILGGDSLTATETRIGIDNTTPATELDVNGTIRQSATTNAIVHADANGDLNPLTIGAGLALTGNSLAATGGGGGATAFTGLTDTPANYSGGAGKHVVVNAAENALEFASAAGGGTTMLPPTAEVIPTGVPVGVGTNRVVMMGGGDGSPCTVPTPASANLDLSVSNFTTDPAVFSSAAGEMFTYNDQSGAAFEGTTMVINSGAVAQFVFMVDPFLDGINRWICYGLTKSAAGRGIDFL